MRSTARSCAITNAQEKQRRERWSCRFLTLAVIFFFGMITLSNEVLGMVGLGLIIVALIIDKNIRRML